MDERTGASGRASEELNPKRPGLFEAGIARRRVLQASGAGATAALAGCLGDSGSEDAPTVFVFNTGDRTVTMIDAETDELVETAFLGATASFPANQYGADPDAAYDILWLNADDGVLGIDQATFDEVAAIETGSTNNYQNLTPDGDHLLVATGGSLGMDPDPDDPENHYYYRVDADPDSETFGDVIDEIERGYEGPCDMTVGPEGEYAFGVDVANETISVLSVDPFEIVTRVDVGDSIVDGGDVLPFMCTATYDGDYLFVENGEGDLGPEGDRVGSESIWDVSDPEEPVEITKITPDDGLPGMPITSEIDPDSEAAYLFIPGAEGVGVIDIESQAYETTIDVGGSTLGGAWGPNREKLYAPVQTANEVAVIDHESRDVIEFIETGDAPAGAAAGVLRPDLDELETMRARLATMGIGWGELRATYCYPDCYCGRTL